MDVEKRLNRTDIPGLQASRMYFPLGSFAIWSTTSGGTRASKPVPPPGRRTKRFVMGTVRWDPGRNERAPLWGVHASSAIQKPRALGGSVY